MDVVQILDNVPDKAREGKLLLLLALDKSAGVMNGNVPLDAVLILVSQHAFSFASDVLWI